MVTRTSSGDDSRTSKRGALSAYQLMFEGDL